MNKKAKTYLPWLLAGVICVVLSKLDRPNVYFACLVGGTFIAKHAFDAIHGFWFDEIHRRISLREFLVRSAFAGSGLLGLTWAVLSDWSRPSASLSIGAALVFIVIGYIEGALEFPILRASVRKAMRSGPTHKGNLIAWRLYDRAIVKRLIAEGKSDSRCFAKSMSVLAQFKESRGDWEVAFWLYGWVAAEWIESAETSRGLRPTEFRRLIEALCGKVRVARFYCPKRASSEMEMVSKLVERCGDQVAMEEFILVGGLLPLEGVFCALNGEALTTVALRRAAHNIIDYSGWPDFRSCMAALLLVRNYCKVGNQEEGLKVLGRLEQALPMLTDSRHRLLIIEAVELKANILTSLDRHEDAYIALDAALSRAEEYLISNGESSGEAELMALSAMLARVGSRYVGIIAEHFAKRCDRKVRAFEACRRFKGIATRVRLSLSKALADTVGDGHDKEAAEVASLRRKMSDLWTSSRDTAQLFNIERTELDRREAFLISTRLGKGWIRNVYQTAFSATTLSTSDVLVETLEVEFSSGVKHYVMFCVTAESWDNPRFFDCGDSGMLNQAITEWRELIQCSGSPTNMHRATSLLSRSILEPILDSAGDKQRIVFAPDAAFCGISMSAIPPCDSTKCPSELIWNYVTSSGDSGSARAVNLEEASSPVVFADPAFDWGSGTASSMDCMHDATVSEGGYFSPLPNTVSEGKLVSAYLGGVLRTQQDASVLFLKSIRNPAVLHIATHGFCFDQVEVKQPSNPTRWERFLTQNDPLARTGLALTGVNSVMRGHLLSDEFGDGILSALEACTLNLQSTNLVVLSACDTGLGLHHIGEGVLGLRRAFMLAGAAAVVASLWKVPDLQTKIFMENFYGQMGAGIPIDVALRNAQTSVRKLFPQPLYWAGFVYYSRT